MNRLSLFLSIIFLMLTAPAIFGQGLMCEESEPFCTGTIYTFPAGTTGTAQPGADYGCLQTQPAPVWYHMLIDDPGPITIYMYSTPLRDIDFICWGPFEDPYEPCVTGLTSSMEVDCSYSPQPQEYCDIPFGQTGEYYILMITNYSQQPCDITFSQTAGSGSTDCTILPPPVSNNSPLCVSQTLELYAETINNATYFWAGPAGFLSTQQNPVIPNVTTANAGQYSCTITVNGNSSDPATTSVVVFQNPTLELTSSDTIVCPNTPAYLIVDINGFGSHSVEYSDGTATFTATGLSPPFDTIIVYPVEPTTYQILEVCNANCCGEVTASPVFIDTYPQTTGTISGSVDICEGEPAQLTFNLEGTSPWNVTYTANGSDPQVTVAASSPHTITVYPDQSTLYEISLLQDAYCIGETSGIADVVVAPSADVSAGQDQVINYGTSTTLNGQVSGGSGNYTVQWEPASLVTNPSDLNTATENLTETTIFTLNVIDNQGGCFTADNVTITVEGGALGCLPVASPQAICVGQTSGLTSLAYGGSGEYAYLWTSDPPGFSSDLANPQVAPQVTTTYTVFVNDGFNVVNGSVTVSVNDLPVPDAGADKSIPNGAFVTLAGLATAGSGNYSFQWEPAGLLVNPTEQNPTTINLFSTTLFSLQVTDLETGCVSDGTDQVTITVSGDVLAVNPVAEPDEFCSGEGARLFALPGGGSGNYTCTWSGPGGFFSDEENPVIDPPTSGFFEVVVDDGYNQASGSVFVRVNPSPEVYLGPPDSIVCVYDTVILDAGAGGLAYLWSNGSTERSVKVGTTGIGYDLKSLSVEVTGEGGCKTFAEINVHFDFSMCLGISDHPHFGDIKIYPNPNNGSFRFSVNGFTGDLRVTISDMLGKEVFMQEYPGIDNEYETDINLMGMQQGIYIISFGDRENVHSDKLVIR